MPLAGTITSVRLSRALARQQQRAVRPGAIEARRLATRTAAVEEIKAERKAAKEKPKGKPGRKTKAQNLAAAMNQEARERNSQPAPVRRRHVWTPGQEDNG
jgi:hypothetical protein